MAASAQDLQVVLQILNRASQRAIFQLPQYSVVGALFAKIQGLLAAEEGEESKETLEVQDVRMMKELIELCSERGVFKAAEMTPVGGLYEKLSKALEAAPQPQEDATPPMEQVE